MNRTFKLLALILALMLTVSAFAACNGGEDTTTETPSGEIKLERKNIGGLKTVFDFED
jgi:hypothetical protein